MRIIGKEIGKISNIVLIVFLILFSLLYVSEIPSMSANWWDHTASAYDVDLHRELIGIFGATVTEEEWDDLLSFRQGLINDLTDILLDNDVLRNNGIYTYDMFEERYDELVTERNDNELLQEFDRIFFDDDVTSPLCFKIQAIDFLISAKDEGYVFCSPEDEDTERKINALYGLRASSIEIRERVTELWTGNELSLLHEALTENVKDDLVRMTVLSVIWCFVLILPYQITERLRNVRDLQLTSKTGRDIYRKQTCVCALAGLVIGILVAGVYAILLWRKGAFAFIMCPINIPVIHYWTDMTYGQFLLLYAAELIMTSVTAALLAYIIGRASSNYITGLGISIPSAVLLCAAVRYFMSSPLELIRPRTVSYIFVLIPLIILPAVFIILTRAVLKHDKVRDIL